MPLVMVLLASAVAAPAPDLWTARDPFVGKWKLDVSKSVVVDRMVVEAAGPGQYAFRFEGSPAETVTADGTDQPGEGGTTLAVKAEDPRTLKVVRKQGTRIVISATWTLSPDDRALHDAFTAVQADGTSSTTNYVYRRVAAGAGFVGAWESTTPPLGLVYELEIRPLGGQGLAFVRQAGVKNVTFDGQEHAIASTTPGSTASGQRRSARALQVTDKTDGKVVDTQALALAADGATLTINLSRTGQVTPDVLVFKRE